MNPSLRTLGQLRRGQFVTDLDTELATLVDAVRDTGRKGRLTVTLEIQPAGKGDNITLRVTDSINSKPPQPETGDTLMFATADGQLSRQDPRQIEMEGIREVRKPQQGETA